MRKEVSGDVRILMGSWVYVRNQTKGNGGPGNVGFAEGVFVSGIFASELKRPTFVKR